MRLISFFIVSIDIKAAGCTATEISRKTLHEDILTTFVTYYIRLNNENLAADKKRILT
jgi:hypothetical protein